MKRRLLRRVRGSHTVEASLLLPVGIGLILFVISCSMILHDRVVLSAWIHETAQMEAFQKPDEEAELPDPAIPWLVSEPETEKAEAKRLLTIRGGGENSFVSPLVKGLFLLGEPYMEKEETVRLLYGEEEVW